MVAHAGTKRIKRGERRGERAAGAAQAGPRFKSSCAAATGVYGVRGGATGRSVASHRIASQAPGAGSLTVEEEEEEEDTGPSQGRGSSTTSWDMAAGLKAFDLLVGVVLVVRCAELYAAETAARSHGKEPLFLTRARPRAHTYIHTYTQPLAYRGLVRSR